MFPGGESFGCKVFDTGAEAGLEHVGEHLWKQREFSSCVDEGGGTSKAAVLLRKNALVLPEGKSKRREGVGKYAYVHSISHLLFFKAVFQLTLFCGVESEAAVDG